MQVSSNKRYAAAAGLGFTVSEVAKNVEADFGKIDILVHSLANGPEVTKPLMETSRKVCCRLSFLKMRHFPCKAQGHRNEPSETLLAAETGVPGSTERVRILLCLHAAALWPHHESRRGSHFTHIPGLREDHSWCACCSLPDVPSRHLPYSV